jgi:hypothetical protein
MGREVGWDEMGWDGVGMDGEGGHAYAQPS